MSSVLRASSQVVRLLSSQARRTGHWVPQGQQFRKCSAPVPRHDARCLTTGSPAPTDAHEGSQSTGGRMLFVATCKVCDGVMRREFSKQAYSHGVVIVQCDGCESRHLIADNLGWFGESKNIEEEMRKAGKTLVRVSEGAEEALPPQTSFEEK